MFEGGKGLTYLVPKAVTPFIFDFVGIKVSGTLEHIKSNDSLNTEEIST